MDNYIIVLKTKDNISLLPVSIDSNNTKLYIGTSKYEVYERALAYIDSLSYKNEDKFEICVYEKIETPEKPVKVEIEVPSRNIIKELKDAGIFDRYGIKITKGHGVYMTTSEGKRIEITKDNISEAFDIDITSGE